MIKRFRGYTLILFTCLLVATNALWSQSGKYAGSMKKLVGASYMIDSKDMPSLKQWKMREGTVLSAYNDPETIIVNVYQKGTTWVFFMSISDSASAGQSLQKMNIVDAVEVKNVAKGYEIKTALCREYKQDNTWIVALIKPAAVPFSKAIKAWRFSRDKIQFQAVSAKVVDCSNEGYEQN